MCKEEKGVFQAIPNKECLEIIRNSECLGICVQIAMVSRNLTIKEFAEKVEVTPQAIHAIINNNRKPSGRLLRDMLKILGLKTQQFMEIIEYYDNYEGEFKYTYTLFETVKRVVENIDNNVF